MYILRVELFCKRVDMSTVSENVPFELIRMDPIADINTYKFMQVVLAGYLIWIYLSLYTKHSRPGRIFDMHIHTKPVFCKQTLFR